MRKNQYQKNFVVLLLSFFSSSSFTFSPLFQSGSTRSLHEHKHDITPARTFRYAVQNFGYCDSAPLWCNRFGRVHGYPGFPGCNHTGFRDHARIRNPGIWFKCGDSYYGPNRRASRIQHGPGRCWREGLPRDHYGHLPGWHGNEQHKKG